MAGCSIACSVYLFIYLSLYSLACPTVCPIVCLSVCLFVSASLCYYPLYSIPLMIVSGWSFTLFYLIASPFSTLSCLLLLVLLLLLLSPYLSLLPSPLYAQTQLSMTACTHLFLCLLLITFLSIICVCLLAFPYSHCLSILLSFLFPRCEWSLLVRLFDLFALLSISHVGLSLPVDPRVEIIFCEKPPFTTCYKLNSFVSIVQGSIYRKTVQRDIYMNVLWKGIRTYIMLRARIPRLCWPLEGLAP